MSEAPEFQFALNELEESYRAGLRAFVSWAQKSWCHDTKEQWCHEEPWPGEDFESGFNRAITSLDLALDVFLDEMRP
jgi:hypothetical protein